MYNAIENCTIFSPVKPKSHSTMQTLNLKPTHKPVKTYYAALDQFARLDVTHETAVRAAFQALLEHCARQCRWTLVPEFGVSTGRGRRIVVDGTLVDDFRLTHGCWEAKDDDDDLPAEVERKFAAGAIRYSQTLREEGAR